MTQKYRALIVEEQNEGEFRTRVNTLDTADLPPGDLLIRVDYSSLNYKDALSASGNRGVTRKFPHTPGIDAAGVVAESEHEAFAAGDEVIVIGYDLGMNTPGGFGEYIRVPADWAVPKPDGLSLQESMILGTAGFTAAQSVQALIQAGVVPDDGEIVVSGGTGGVGTIAIALLSKLGYSVVASTGKADKSDYLLDLGAARTISREAIDDTSGRPLLKQAWAGAIDTVGGNTLATLLKSVSYRGVVTACGLVGGNELQITVFPFILRQVSLLGIDSVNCPLDERYKIWGRLAESWKLPQLPKILAREVTLEELPDEIARILQGGQIGRVLVRHG